MNLYRDKCFVDIDKLVKMIQEENIKQVGKWGIQNRTAFEWMTYITEEIGELAEAITEFEYRNGKIDNIITEAIHSATLCLKIAEMFNKLKDGK